MGGGCRTCQELEALFGCWMAAGWRKSEAAGRWRVANQGGEEVRGIRFSADSQMVLVPAVYGQYLYLNAVGASCGAMEMPGLGSPMCYFAHTPAITPVDGIMII
jgi:hypothetical protein